MVKRMTVLQISGTNTPAPMRESRRQASKNKKQETTEAAI